MAQKKSSPSRHMGGDGKEYNKGVTLNAKMTPEMRKRLASSSKGRKK